ncbi:hypothetical protein KFU94_49010 [Chloroflexi bacterium TSY]|nr:hypothetical protein [Chloroflexi bacterium TSY]
MYQKCKPNSEPPHQWFPQPDEYKQSVIELLRGQARIPSGFIDYLESVP